MFVCVCVCLCVCCVCFVFVFRTEKARLANAFDVAYMLTENQTQTDDTEGLVNKYEHAQQEQQQLLQQQQDLQQQQQQQQKQ